MSVYCHQTKNIMKAIPFLTLVIVITSCTSSQFTQLNSTPESGDVAVFYHTQTPDRDYEIIGHIETSGWIFTSNKALIKGLSAKAKNATADAVIDVEFDHIPHISSGIPMVSGLAVRWR